MTRTIAIATPTGNVGSRLHQEATIQPGSCSDQTSRGWAGGSMAITTSMSAIATVMGLACSRAEGPSVIESVHTAITRETDAQYRAQNSLNSCSTWQDMLIYRPTAAGDYPVLIYLSGTNSEHDGYHAERFLKEAAAQGFIAASIDYRNGVSAAAGCGALDAKAKCIFDPDRPASAVSQLCSQEFGDVRADCRLGIVTTGHGQGGAIAMLASDWNSDQIRASWAQGTPFYTNDVRSARGYRSYDWESCLKDIDRGGTRMLPNNRLRLTAGESDRYSANGDLFTGIFQLEPGETVAAHLRWMIGGPRFDDLDADDPPWSSPAPRSHDSTEELGGYYVIGDSDVEDGTADHCPWQNARGASYDATHRECYPDDPGGSAGAGWDEGLFAWGNPYNIPEGIDWLRASTGNPFEATSVVTLVPAPHGGRIDVLHNDSWDLPLNKVVFDSPDIEAGNWTAASPNNPNALCKSFDADAGNDCSLYRAQYPGVNCWIDDDENSDGRMHVGCRESYHCWDVGLRPDPSLCHGGFDVKLMDADGGNRTCLTCDPEVREALGLPDKNIGQPAWHNASGGRFLVVEVQNGDTDDPNGPWNELGFGWCKEPCFAAHPGGGAASNLWLLELNPGGNSIKKAVPITALATLPKPGSLSGPDAAVLHPHFSDDGSRLLWGQMWQGSRPFPLSAMTGYWTINWADFDVFEHTKPLDPSTIHRIDPGDTSVTPCQPVRDPNYAVATDRCEVIESGQYEGAWFETHGFAGESNERVVFSSNLPNKLSTASQIYIYDLTTDSLELLSNGSSDYHEITVFSPDNQHILYLSSRSEYEDQGLEWWVMNADTSAKTQVTLFDDPASWMHDPDNPTPLALDADWLHDQSGVIGYRQLGAGKRQGDIVRVQFGGPRE